MEARETTARSWGSHNLNYTGLLEFNYGKLSVLCKGNNYSIHMTLSDVQGVQESLMNIRKAR